MADTVFPGALDNITSGLFRTAPTLHSVLNAMQQTIGTTAASGPVYYVATTGNDSNTGKTWGQAFATVGGALTAIGGTANNTNAAVIQLGAGTFDDHVVGTHVVKGVVGFRIKGMGKYLTTVIGPDAAPWLQAVNTTNLEVSDLEYQGSPGGTGWGIEFAANFSGGVFVGGVTATQNRVRRVRFGGGTTAPSTQCAYGIRWKLYNGSTVNDANNDQGLVEDCEFWNMSTAGLSAEHTNSLAHNFTDCTFVNCGDSVRLAGGSCTLTRPWVFGNAGAPAGWVLNMQAPAGSGTPYYTSPITVVAPFLECTGSTTGIVQHYAGDAGQSAGGISDVTFIGGRYVTVATTLVNWLSTESLVGYNRLTFIGGEVGVARANTVNATSTNSVVNFVDAQLCISTFNCHGILRIDSCENVGGGFGAITYNAACTLVRKGVFNGVPTIQTPLGAAWGAGATAAMVAGSTDEAFIFTVTAGVAPAANPAVGITFSTPQIRAPKSATANAATFATAQVGAVYIFDATPDATQVGIGLLGTPVNGTTYRFSCVVAW